MKKIIKYLFPAILVLAIMVFLWKYCSRGRDPSNAEIAEIKAEKIALEKQQKSWIAEKESLEGKLNENNVIVTSKNDEIVSLRRSYAIRSQEIDQIKLKTANEMKKSNANLDQVLFEDEKKDKYIIDIKLQLSDQINIGLALEKKCETLQLSLNLESAARKKLEKIFADCMALNKILQVPTKKKWFAVVIGPGINSQKQLDIIQLTVGLKILAF